jgi:hypothetical protein
MKSWYCGEWFPDLYIVVNGSQIYCGEWFPICCGEWFSIVVNGSLFIVVNCSLIYCGEWFSYLMW